MSNECDYKVCAACAMSFQCDSSTSRGFLPNSGKSQVSKPEQESNFKNLLERMLRFQNPNVVVK